MNFSRPLANNISISIKHNGRHQEIIPNTGGRKMNEKDKLHSVYGSIITILSFIIGMLTFKLLN